MTFLNKFNITDLDDFFGRPDIPHAEVWDLLSEMKEKEAFQMMLDKAVEYQHFEIAQKIKDRAEELNFKLKS